MSASFRIHGKPGKYMLVERNYVCQGENPYYRSICGLTDTEAAALARSRLIEPLLCDVPMALSAHPGDFLSLENNENGDAVVCLRLPEIDGRSASESRLPDFGLDALLQGNADKTMRFLRNTQIACAADFVIRAGARA